MNNILIQNAMAHSLQCIDIYPYDTIFVQNAPVDFQMHLKMLVTTFKILHGIEPSNGFNSRIQETGLCWKTYKTASL